MNQDKNNKNNNIVEFVADHDKPFHQHLLLNYCFGYKDSTLLLCPYRLLTSHINHDLTNNPNARVVWAHDEQMLHPEWKKKSTEEWGTTEAVGCGGAGSSSHRSICARKPCVAPVSAVISSTRCWLKGP